MFTDFRAALRPAFVLLLLFTILTGLAYPLAITGIAQVVMPAQANGSLVSDGGKVVGSSLIGQGFAAARYFRSRPSAAGKGYEANNSSGSNLAPGSADLVKRITGDIAALRKDGVTGPVPADLVTSSASGLDPDISPEAARIQVPRVAKTRGLPEGEVAALVDAAIDTPIVPFFGDAHVNVLNLNRQLDRIAAKPAR